MNKTRRAILGLSIMWGSLLVVDWFVHRGLPQRLLGVGTVQAVSLAFYFVGAAMVVASVGASISWQVLGGFDLREFQPSRHLSYRLGLWINRIASIVPPVYLIAVGWRLLPWYIILWNVVDIGIAVGVAFVVTPLIRTLRRGGPKA